MTRTRKPTTRLAIEALESRLTPAGNVTAQFVDPFGQGNPPSVLVIVGDNQANEIRVVEDAPDHVRIVGLGTTTVNGKAADDLFSSLPVISFADVNLGNGSDSVSYELTGSQDNHGILIETGNGDDSVALSVRGIVGFVGINTDAGDDNVTFDLAAGSVLLNGLRVNTGFGDDSVLFHADAVGGLPLLAGFCLIETAEGNDTAQFQGAFGVLGSSMSVSLGAGDDTVIGDSEFSGVRVECIGGAGHDTVLNASYFSFAPLLFETIED